MSQIDHPVGYDVVVIGGALAGASTAFLLLQEDPGLKILILDRTTELGRRVGEATIEISTYFLTHRLGLTQHLNECHLNKQGLRFWFANEKTQSLPDCSEIGGRYLSRVPSYLVDRAVLDEEVLKRAHAAGAHVWRDVTVQKVELVPGGQQIVHFRREEAIQTVQARWVVDASGVAALLARQEGWWRPNTEHPTTSVWSRWRKTKSWDSLELQKKFPAWAASCFGQRSTATNHLMGDGWWAWWIALKGGDVSIGVVFDQRLVRWPEGGSLGARLKEFLCRHPVGQELMQDAEWTEGDVHWRKNLAYYTTTFAGDGFALVGDAAGFLDPFYSPGLDWVTFTTSSAVDLILTQRRGEAVAARVERLNRDFNRSYHRWFQAIYQNKYEYLGEHDLLRLAFLMDLGFYYHGLANQPFKRGAVALLEPYYATPPSTPFFYFMRAYNRRFANIAHDRRARKMSGQKNCGHCFMFPGYSFHPVTMIHLAKAICGWIGLELTEGWRTWFVRPEAPKNSAPPASAAAEPRPAPDQAL